MYDEKDSNIGSRIQALRQEQNMTQLELAKRCGYSSRSTIYKIECGIRNLPLAKIEVIARALNVPVNKILGEKISAEVHPNTTSLKYKELNDLYDKLNQLGKQKAIETLEDLSCISKYTK